MYTDEERKLIDTLVTLWHDLTSPETDERIRRGPHVALIEQTLREIGVNWHAWIVEKAE